MQKVKKLSAGRQARQGDELLVPIKTMPANSFEEKIAPQERAIVAHGEKTGHKHEFETDQVISRRRFNTDKVKNVLVVEVTNEPVLRHPEHDHIATPPDVFVVDQQVEYDYSIDDLRNVSD